MSLGFASKTNIFGILTFINTVRRNAMRLCYTVLFIGLMLSAWGQQSTSLDDAKRLYDEGKYREALALLDKIIDSSSENFEALLIKGDCLQKDERYVAAVQTYQKAEKLNDNSAPLNTNHGAAYLNLDQTEEARKLLKKALKIDPNYPEAHYFMGNLYFLEFSVSNALRHYNEALKLKPEFRDALYMRAAAHTELGKYREALRDYEAVLDLDPGLESASYHMAVVYLEADDYKKSAELLLKIDVSKLANPADYYYHLGEALYFSNNKESACENYEKASELGDSESKDLYMKYCLGKQEREALRQKRTIRAAF